VRASRFGFVIFLLVAGLVALARAHAQTDEELAALSSSWDTPPHGRPLCWSARAPAELRPFR